VEVSFLPGDSAALLSLPERYQAGDDWHLYDVAVPAGFCAAVAASKPVRLQVQRAEEITDFQL